MNKYKELIKLLRECSTGRQCQKCRREKDPLCMVNFMTEAADVIEELLQVQDQMGDDIAMMNEELLKHEWIPVSERLPEEKNEDYWVCLDNGGQCQCRWTNNVFGLGAHELSKWGWSVIDKPQYARIVAWQPLPETYKGGKE